MKYLYIFFTDSQKPYLKWLPEGCRHTHAILHDEYRGVAVGVDTAQSGINLDVYSLHSKAFEEALDSGIGKLYTSVYKVPIKRWSTCYIGIFSCVEIVKRTAGIRKWWIQTPPQLKKYLEKKGYRYESKTNNNPKD